MRQLNRTFRDILFGSEAFDTPATSNLNETDICASCAQTQGPEKIASVLRTIFSVMDAFEVLKMLVFCVLTTAYYMRRDAGSAERGQYPGRQ